MEASMDSALFTTGIAFLKNALATLFIPRFAPEACGCREGITSARIFFGAAACISQHFLYFFPEPQGQGSFRPVLCIIPLNVEAKVYLKKRIQSTKKARKWDTLVLPENL
jgi:hypothetical protein